MEHFAAREVWGWQEFQELSERLGIDVTRSTTRLSITFDFDTGLVEIDHKYLAERDG